MKVIYYICCIIGMFLYTGTAYSSILPSLDTDSLIHTKTKPNHAKPKTFSNNSFLSISSSLNDATKQTKLASVTFISKGSLDYEMSESSSGNCTADNYPYTSEMGLANCETIEKCRDKNIVRARCVSCKGNMTLSDHKCSCDKAHYTHDMYQNPCVYAYDQEDYCQEIGPDNVLRNFYADCTCPSDWSECNGEGEAGFGGACTSKGKVYYFGCTCTDPYTLTCTGSNGSGHYDEAPSGKYCESVITHTRYYKNCAEVCWNGYYHSAEDWWNQTCCSE